MPFSGKIGDSNGVKKGEKKTKKELFSHFFKKSDLDFSHTFRDNFFVLSRVYIFFGPSSKKRSSRQRSHFYHQSPSSFKFTLLSLVSI